MSEIDLQNVCGFEYLKNVGDGSVDLVLTDPPYIISMESGMDTLYKKVKKNEEENIVYDKTEAEWEQYKAANGIEDDAKKTNYMKYGSIYGKKYAVKTDYGEWDKKFTLDELDKSIALYYNKLRKGGTLIVFIDIWKITTLKDIMEKHKFEHI